MTGSDDASESGATGTGGTNRIPSLGPRGEGWVALQVVCFGLIAVALAYAPPETDTDMAAIGTRQIMGYMVGMIGAVLLGAGIAELRRAKALTAVPHPLPGATLVERGPYRFVRHPIYGGLILGALGLAVITPWPGTFAAVGLLAVVLDLKRRREEAWLGDRYPGYAAYRGRTRALIPFLY
ncbi:MAG: isoprenylcysteine carboxylmethyltransferase family protein [Chloroflexi bacterium]|nr:isoprenylcysteine carboxylmethyltransferase family protein [Chloroflexota bacterium]